MLTSDQNGLARVLIRYGAPLVLTMYLVYASQKSSFSSRLISSQYGKPSAMPRCLPYPLALRPAFWSHVRLNGSLGASRRLGRPGGSGGCLGGAGDGGARRGSPVNVSARSLKKSPIRDRKPRRAMAVLDDSCYRLTSTRKMRSGDGCPTSFSETQVRRHILPGRTLSMPCWRL